VQDKTRKRLGKGVNFETRIEVFATRNVDYGRYPAVSLLYV